MVVVSHDVHMLRDEHGVDVQAWIDRAKVTLGGQPGFLRFEAGRFPDDENRVHVLLAFQDDAALGTWTRSDIHDALMRPLVTHSTQQADSHRYYRFGDRMEVRKAVRACGKAFRAAVEAGDTDAVQAALDGFSNEE